jgi:beta-phosphoglucomutase family hydrolase
MVEQRTDPLAARRGPGRARRRGRGAALSVAAPIEGVILDLDGVITRTARVHAGAWKRLFDDFLRARAAAGCEPFVPFDADTEYRRYVDGKPRYDGVMSFLAARGVDLPRGTPDDPPGAPTVVGLGKAKDAWFREALERDGVEVFPGTLAFVALVEAAGWKVGVVTSSRNGRPVLARAGLLERFPVIVDGVDQARLGLPGKPDPASFVEAARRLGVPPARAVVVEDAIAGVQAGAAGGFACVIGVDRQGRPGALRAGGADLVVADLGEVRELAALPVRGGGPPGAVERAARVVGGAGGGDDAAHTDAAAAGDRAWVLAFEGFDPDREPLREALCVLGNGYVATRGAAPEAPLDGPPGRPHYPGTYLAGGYDRLTTRVAGRDVENEDLVNLPNWLPLTFRPRGGAWLDLAQVEILAYRQSLDLLTGTLRRELRVRDGQGRTTRIRERRLVHLAERHVAALEWMIVPEDWSGPLALRATLDGQVRNDGVARYRDLRGDHLLPMEGARVDAETVWLKVRTRQSDLRVALAARTRAFDGGGERGGGAAAGPPVSDTTVEPGRVAQVRTVEVRAGRPLRVEKVATLFTSRDPAISECGLAARERLAGLPDFAALHESHVRAWARQWRRFGIFLETTPDVDGERALLELRLHLFHLAQTVSPHTTDLDVGVPARGWHGEAYRGHIFWDELFILPLLDLRAPELTRALLRYRYRRLGAARAAARAEGRRGALFPWQSGSDGREETQVLHLNPRSGRWLADHTRLQRHVNAAIAWNVWQYVQVTDDAEFLSSYGAELLLEIARFWADAAEWNEAHGRYEIRGVVGPDEYHVALPGADEPGLRNNTYTNVMAVWCLGRAEDALARLPETRARELCAELGLTAEERARWADVATKMRVVFHADGVPTQFEGYEQLEVLDWDRYRARHGPVMRLDRILEAEGEAEGDDVNRYQASKQADVLMLFYLFRAEELRALFGRMGYEFDPAVIPRTIEYYEARTSHGSTLSQIVTARVLARSDRAGSWDLFRTALSTDVDDLQGGTTAEGIHLGAMAGTVDLVQRAYAGVDVLDGVLHVDPSLPRPVRRIALCLQLRGRSVEVEVTRETVRLACRGHGRAPLRVAVYGGAPEDLADGETRTWAAPS